MSDKENEFSTKELYNADKVTITDGDIVKNLWVKGYCTRYPDYKFHAKIFDVGSRYGIKQGRISKLSVYDKSGKQVMHYDRGWPPEGKPPRLGRHKTILNEILSGFPEIETAKERKIREQREKPPLWRGELTALRTAKIKRDLSSKDHNGSRGFFQKNDDLER